jgi:hypothetical protein
VDSAVGERLGIFMVVVEFIFGVVAGGALVFVCEVSVGAKVSDFKKACDYVDVWKFQDIGG